MHLTKCQWIYLTGGIMRQPTLLTHSSWPWRKDTVLRSPDFSAPFIIVVDTSKKRGVGAVLCQLDEKGNEGPIEYASPPTTEAHRKFGITHLEGLGVCWTVKRWRRYLFGSVGIIITNHKSLQALSNAAKGFDSPRGKKPGANRERSARL